MSVYPQTPSVIGQVNGEYAWATPASNPPGPPAPPYMSVMNQFPQDYVGYELKPRFSDGKYSWEHITEHRMEDAKLSELIGKDLNKNRIDEMWKNESLSSAQKQRISRILESQVASDVNSGMTWILALVKLSREITKTQKGKNIIEKTNITLIRIVLKRVWLPIPGPDLYSGPQPGQAAIDPRIPRNPNTVLHQDIRDHGNSRALFGEAMHSPSHHYHPPGMIRMHAPEEVQQDLFEEDSHSHKGHKSHKKSGKKGKDKEESEPIYIPTIRPHARHSSKHSSRPTSWADSDGTSHFGSPLTSVSNSPEAGGLHGSKHHGERYKNYRSKDGFVVIPNSSHRKHRSMNSGDKIVLGPSRQYYQEPRQSDDSVLASTIERIHLNELDKKRQEFQQIQRDAHFQSELDDIKHLLQQKQQPVVQDRPRYYPQPSNNYNNNNDNMRNFGMPRRRHGDRYVEDNYRGGRYM